MIDTLVTPADGRDVLSVSGGRGALAYTTADRGEGDDRADRRHYVRWPGEETGTQLDGPVVDWPSVLIGP